MSIHLVSFSRAFHSPSEASANRSAGQPEARLSPARQLRNPVERLVQHLGGNEQKGDISNQS